MSETEAVRAALTPIIDPELGFSIVALGLVRTVTCHDGTATVTMTLTSPLCPLREHFRAAITTALTEAGWQQVTVAFSLSPRWTLAEAAEEVREELALRGIGTVQW